MADDKIAEALRALLETPGLLQEVINRAQRPKTVSSTVKDLVIAWEAQGLAGNLKSPWRLKYGTHVKWLIETELTMPDGSKIRHGDLLASQLSPDGTCALFKRACERRVTRRGAPPSPVYIDDILSTLQMAMEYHVAFTKHLDENPVAGWERVDSQIYARKTVLTPEQFAAYIAHGHPAYQDIATVQYRGMGMRPTEALCLRKSELLWDRLLIYLNPNRIKNKRSEPFPMADDIIPILRRCCETSRGEYVFVRPDDPTRSQPIPYDTYRYWFRECRRKSGMQGVNGEAIVPYHFRHSGITQALTDGIPAPFVSKAARVSMAIMTRTYSKLLEDQQEAMREVLNRRSIKPVFPDPDKPSKR